MNRSTLIVVVTLLLAVAIGTRLVSMLGLDVNTYRHGLSAYFRTDARATVFLVQYIGIAFVFVTMFLVKPNQSSTIIMAAIFLSVVSIARYIVPIFFVSVIGDVLVIAMMRSALASQHVKDKT